MDRLKQVPFIGSLVQWADAYPRLAAWFFLSAGMVVILLFEARDVGLEFGQWFALVVATVLVAGACIWIVSWEDEDELESEAAIEPGSEAAQLAEDAETEAAG